MKIKFFFAKDQVDKGEIRIEHCGTEDMSADFLVNLYRARSSLNLGMES